MSEYLVGAYQPAPLSDDEEQRLADLYSTGVLDTAAQVEFDDITALAAELLDMPVALVSLVDRDRQWFKSRVGLEVTETARDIAFCAHAILGPEFFIVPDATQDERFAHNPLVCGDPHIRFYAGVPLKSRQGHALGTLCVIDHQPRNLLPDAQNILRRLSRVCVALIEAHRDQVKMRYEMAFTQRMLNSIPDAVMVCDDHGKLSEFNTVAKHWHPLLERGQSLDTMVHCCGWFEANHRLMTISHPLAQAQQGHSVENYPLCIRQSGQPDRDVLATGGPIHTKTQQDGAMIVLRDITRLKAEQKARDEESQRLERILQITGAGIWAWDMIENVLRINPSWMQRLGLNAEQHVELSAATWRQLIHPEDVARVDEALKAHRAGELDMYEVTFRLQADHGRWVWLQSRGQIVERDADGSPVSMLGAHIDVSSMKALERLTIEQQVLLSAIAQSSVDVSIIATDVSGLITLFSRGAENLLGYCEQDVVGILSPSIFHDPEEIMLRGRELAGEGCFIEGFDVFVYPLQNTATDTRLWTYISRSGSRHTVRLSISALHDHVGQVSGYVGIAIDMTEQLKAQAMAHLNEQRMMQAFRSAAHGMAMVGIDGRWLEVNEALCRILGYEREQLLTMDVLSLTHPDDRELSFHSHIELLDSERDVYQMRKRYLRSDGSTLWGLLSIAVVNDASGQASSYVAQIQDITSQLRAEQELEASEEFQRRLIEQVANAIISIDEHALITSFNQAAERMFGYQQEEVWGRNVSMLMPQPFRSQHDAYISRHQEGGESLVLGKRRELVGLRQDGGEFPIELMITELTSSQQCRQYIGVIRDLTEQKRVEQLANEFISTISHELRTPLTSMLGGIGLILGGVMGGVSDEQRSLLEMAQANGQRLTALVNDLLDMEKLQAGQMKFQLSWWKLETLLREAMQANLGYAQRYEVELEILPFDTSWQILVDRLRFGQVMANLLSNAIKFSPHLAKVSIEAHAKAGRVYLAVLDRGPGVSEKFRKRLFEKFAQADAGDTRLLGGTGLGLAISQDIVKRMHGEIGYEDREGGGGCFWVSLPLR